jgi:tetratricopeptide (TPR) repeat protein/class 3 adenylate cyclase
MLTQTDYDRQLQTDLASIAETLGGEDILRERLLGTPWMQLVSRIVKEEKEIGLGEAILMVDLAGYSRLCLDLPSEVVIRVMDKFHFEMFKVAERYRGQLMREPLGDATVYSFENLNFAKAAAEQMQIVMKTFVDEEMRKNLLSHGYRTDYIPITVGIVEGPTNLRIESMGERRNIVFISGETYRRVMQTLKGTKERGVIVGEAGIVSEDEMERARDFVPEQAPAVVDVSSRVSFATGLTLADLFKSTTIGDPKNLEVPPGISKEYTNICAIRIEDFEGTNILSDPTHPHYDKIFEVLNKFCCKYRETEVCKSGDGGELILTNRDAVELIKMIHETFEEIKKICECVPKGGIFEGVFYVENLYPSLSEIWRDMHSPAFAYAVRTVNLPETEGLYVDERLCDSMVGIDARRLDFSLHNMGKVSLVQVRRITEDFGRGQMPLVGRDSEINAVKQFFESEDVVFLFAGEPGMAKTRLLKDLVEKSKEQRSEDSLGHDCLAVYIEEQTPRDFLRALLDQLFLQSSSFQGFENPKVYEEKIEEFYQYPHELPAFIAKNSVRLKLFLPKLHQMSHEMLVFLSAIISNSKSHYLQVVGSFTKNKHVTENFNSMGFGPFIDNAFQVGDLDENLVMEFIEDTTEMPLTVPQRNTLKQAGILTPQILEYFSSFLIPGGVEALMTAVQGTNKSIILQKIVKEMMVEKQVSREEEELLRMLSLFDEPVEIDLLVEIFPETDSDLLERRLESLIEKGLVKKDRQRGYSLFKLSVLTVLQSKRIVEMDDLRRKAGKFFQKISENCDDETPQKISLMDRVVRYLTSIEDKKESDFVLLISVLEEAKRIAEKQSSPQVALRFLTIKRAIFEKEYSNAKRTQSANKEELEKKLVDLALEEGELAFSLGKPSEAKVAYDIVIELLDSSVPLVSRMKVLRAYDRVLRMLGYSSENQELIAANMKALEETEFHDPAGNRYKKALIKITEMVAKISGIEAGKEYSGKKADLEQMYVEAVDIYQREKDILSPHDLYDLTRIMTAILTERIEAEYFENTEIIDERISVLVGMIEEVIEKIGNDNLSRYDMAIKCALLRLPMGLFHRSVHKTQGKTCIKELQDAANKLLEYAMSIRDSAVMGRALNHLGEASFFDKDFTKAENFYKMGREANSEEIHVRLPVTINLSRTYFEMERYEEAFLEARKARQIMEYHGQGIGYERWYKKTILDIYNNAAEKIGMELMSDVS